VILQPYLLINRYVEALPVGSDTLRVVLLFSNKSVHYAIRVQCAMRTVHVCSMHCVLCVHCALCVNCALCVYCTLQYLPERLRWQHLPSVEARAFWHLQARLWKRRKNLTPVCKQQHVCA